MKPIYSVNFSINAGSIVHKNILTREQKTEFGKQQAIHVGISLICGSPPNYTLQCATLSLTLSRLLTFWTKNWYTVFSVLGNGQINFGLSTPFCFRVKSFHGTERQTEGWTDGQDPLCGVLGQPHNKHSICVWCFM